MTFTTHIQQADPRSASPRIIKIFHKWIITHIFKIKPSNVPLQTFLRATKWLHLFLKQMYWLDASCHSPISVTSVVFKFLWIIIVKYLHMQFLHKNILLDKHQSGIQYGDSTNYQLVEIFNTMICDISYAFDKIRHECVIFHLNLRHYKTKNQIIKWIKRYRLNSKKNVVFY